MARANDEYQSLRLSRAETARLVAALLLSVLLHLVIWGGYHTGVKKGWWQHWHMPVWLQRFESKKYSYQAQFAHPEEPTLFVDVSHADADAPKEAKYYSSKNSHAANPNTANANIPKIEGHQTDYVKTETMTRPMKGAEATPGQKAAEPNPSTPAQSPEPPKSPPAPAPSEKTPELAALQPTMPPPEPRMPEETADAPQTPGETALRQPKHFAPQPTPSTTPPSTLPQPDRPRTLKQALAQRNQIPGEQMKQDGGVERHADWAAVDAKSTSFGEYDSTMSEAVSQRWWDLLDSRRFTQDRSGKVVLRFKLKPDGSIIEMQTLENNVGELLGYLCQEAIEEAAPFAKWPPDMVRLVGANYREITFTFYYY